MRYYKLIKWVQLNPGHQREYILPIKDIAINDYLKGKDTISNNIIPISKIKYIILKLLYNDNIKEYWIDQYEKLLKNA